MKTKFFMTVAAMVFTFSISSCGGNNKSTSETGAQEPQVCEQTCTKADSTACTSVCPTDSTKCCASNACDSTKSCTKTDQCKTGCPNKK